jgi:small conductance mechanosensitive channel
MHWPRPLSHCSNQHYWQVYFDTNRLIREAFDSAGFPAPVAAYQVSGAVPPPPGP